MNPLTNMKNVLKLSEQELKKESKSSWHDMYRDSAWIFVGGLPYDLSEGDVICVFSQYGEIVNINLVRDKKTGKQKGFCFICYEDQRSTILAVDNLNGIRILGRTLRVDHVAAYKVPKDNDKTDEETRKLYMEGCAPKPQIPVDNIKRESASSTASTSGGVKLPERLPIRDIKEETIIKKVKVKKEKKKKSKKEKKSKKSKKEKKLKKKKRRQSSSSSSSDSESEDDNDRSFSSDEKSRKKAKRRSRSR